MTSAMINRNVFTQVNQDSGSLTSATTVAHRFDQAGEYKGLLLNSRGDAIAQFAVSVGGGTEATKGPPMELAALPAKVAIDLTGLQGSTATSAAAGDCDCFGSEGEGGEYEVASGGYAVFRVSAGAAGGYAVELYKAAESGRGDKVFDSRALDKNDILAVVLLRPGRYSVVNAANSAKADLKVAYPENIPKLLEPVRVKCTADKIHPADIKVHPTQGIVFTFETASRVKIDLVAPDDRPRRSAPQTPVTKADQKGPGTKDSRRLRLVPRPAGGFRRNSPDGNTQRWGP